MYYRQGSELLLTTDSRWWHNLAGGADVMVHLRGRDQPARAVADTDPVRVTAVVAEMVRRYPRRYTRLATHAADPGAVPRVLIDITLPDDSIV